MKLEKLGNNAWKKVAVGGICGIAVLSVGVLTTSRAKYRTTQSINLVNGKITYKTSDLDLVAMYITDGSTDKPIDSVPGIGYELETTKSKCRANGQEISGSIEYRDNKLYFGEITQKGTRCNVYFKLQEDNEIPRITNVVQLNEEEKTSITIQVTAEDNIGITEYWYAIDSDDFALGSGNTHTFSNLEAGSTHTIKVYVKDIAGNQSNIESKNFSTTADKKTPKQVLDSLGITSSTSSNGTFTSEETGSGGVYRISDGDGTSYFWRGAVTNNYVIFANKCWRIIRINGDGSIRLIYDGATCHVNGTSTTESLISTGLAYNTGNNHNAYVGYKYGSTSSTADYNATHTNTTDSNIKRTLDSWYDSNIGNNAEYSKWIDEEAGFCNDRSLGNSGSGTWDNETYYIAYNRLVKSTAKPTLKCGQSNDLFTGKDSSKGNHALSKPIGLITADEVVFAGGFSEGTNKQYYLYNGNSYWTMSPSFLSGSARVFCMLGDGSLYIEYVNYARGVRPVINLKSTTTFSTINETNKGSKDNPYRVV